jgi:hypothetical protein
MKKALSLILALVLCLSLAACETKPVQSNIQNIQDKSHVELAIEAANALLASEEYQKKSGEFEKRTGSAPKAPKVTYVMEYKISGFDGFDLHLLLINLEMDYAAGDTFYDRTTLVVDLTNGNWCDAVRSDFDKWQNSFKGVCESIEDCYFLFLQPTFMEAGQNGTALWSENESYTVLTGADLEQINNGLKK